MTRRDDLHVNITRFSEDRVRNQYVQAGDGSVYDGITIEIAFEIILSLWGQMSHAQLTKVMSIRL